MKIALAQVNPTVGDLRGNARKIVDFAHEARRRGADLAVFPELVVTGYPPQDLLENAAFVRATEETVEQIATAVPADLAVLFGAPVCNPSRRGKRLFNAALLYEAGRRVSEAHKTLLPTYDVFDEYRYFEPADERRLVEWRGLKLGVHICEDMWNNEELADYHLYEENPVAELADLGADLLVNISASPFSVGKHARRNQVIRDICSAHGLPFVLVNQVGANTEIIFDGDSRVHRSDGAVALCAPSFEEALLIWDTEYDTGSSDVPHDDLEDLHDGLVLGIRDYFHKTSVFNKALVGLSGGIDSAVTCALAVNALGPDLVVGVTMPSRYSSEGSVADSRTLANNLGIEFHSIPISPAVDAFEEMLKDLFAGTPAGVAEENIQARSRGQVLMAVSNKFDFLLLTTGNKSEMAVGYATLYGDMSGGLAVLSDVFKTDVYRLAEFINRRSNREVIPENTIVKAPSAELRPNQTDQDTLPPYDVLDGVLRLYVEELIDLDEIARRTGYDRALIADILARVDRNEYKRRQAAPGLRISAKAFGVGRRLPVVMRLGRDALREIIHQS